MTPKGIETRGAPRTRRGAGLRSGVRRSLLLLALVGAGALGSVPDLHAQDANPSYEEEAARAISVLRSPYCPGFMLEVCTSSQAAALRDSIYDLAAQGMTSDELVEWMVANHGEEWRALPRRSGAGLLAWVIPPLALLIGLGAVVMWIRASRARQAEAVPIADDSISDADRQQLTAALREWEESGHEEA